MSLGAELARALHDDLPDPAPLRVRAVDVAPGGARAAAVVTLADGTREAQVFFELEDAEWAVRGETAGLGPGGWDFGDVEHPVIAGRADARGEVELAYGDVTIRRSVGEDGYYVGVFWDVRLPSDDSGDAPPGFAASIAWAAPGDAEPPCPRFVRQLPATRRPR